MKIVIYQVLPRLFGNTNACCVPNGDINTNGCGKMDAFTAHVLQRIKGLGATHVWYTGIIEHATQTDYSRFGIGRDHPAVVKGKAGSPYAIKDYYDVDPDLATDVSRRMDEYVQLIERTHAAGLKVIMDFVPNHVARQYHSDSQPRGTAQLGQDDDSTVAFSPDNNFYYIPHTALQCRFDMKGTAEEAYREYPAKATGNDRFDACPDRNDWYETVKLNYGVDYLGGRACHFSPVPDTWHKMLDILLFWASRGIDGFRCDMAEMVPVEFWDWAVSRVKAKHPDIVFIGEVYNPALYREYINRGHFDYLYDKVGLYDTLKDIICCRRSATDISQARQSVDDIALHMLNFLENHDEQRIASDFLGGDAQKAIPALIVSALLNANPVMIYFGQEFGERGMDSEGFSGLDGRTTIFDYWSVPTVRRWYGNGAADGRQLTQDEKKIYAQYRKILNIAVSEPAVSDGQQFDLTYANINGWHFNEHRQYAFVRKSGHDLLLVAVNFDAADADVAINLPEHLFHHLDIPVMESTEARDLLTGASLNISLSPHGATFMTIPGYSGRVLKIKI